MTERLNLYKLVVLGDVEAGKSALTTQVQVLAVTNSEVHTHMTNRKLSSAFKSSPSLTSRLSRSDTGSEPRLTAPIACSR
jgi:GTPase SAR1 family protein